MKLSRDQALDLLYYGESEELPGYAREATVQTGSGRWCSYHQLIIRDGHGTFWAADYDLGLTENQDVDEFDDAEEIEFAEVEKVPVTTYEYREKA